MKIDLNTVIIKFQPLLVKFKKYLTFSFVIGFLCIYSFLVLQINILMRREPSDVDYNDRLKTVQRPKIDKAVLDKIQSLQDQNVQVQTLFKQARDNPFSE
jgi:hypothetical protein